VATKPLKVSEAAERAGCDEKTIRRAIAKGELPYRRLGKRKPGTLREVRHIRINPVAFEAWLDAE